MHLVRPVGESQRSERDPHVRQGLVLRQTLGAEGLYRSVDHGEGDLGDGELGRKGEGDKGWSSVSLRRVQRERETHFRQPDGFHRRLRTNRVDLSKVRESVRHLYGEHSEVG